MGGEAIELIGDLGTGKTVFVRGLAAGIDSSDQVQSPSFTINRVYRGRDDISIFHYDFHRLDEPGLLKETLAETVEDPKVVIVVEWSDIVREVLPKERLQITFDTTGDEVRRLTFKAYGKTHKKLLSSLTDNRQTKRK